MLIVLFQKNNMEQSANMKVGVFLEGIINLQEQPNYKQRKIETFLRGTRDSCTTRPMPFHHCFPRCFSYATALESSANFKAHLNFMLYGAWPQNLVSQEGLENNFLWTLAFFTVWYIYQQGLCHTQPRAIQVLH